MAIPQEKIDVFLGDPAPRGGLKLRLAYRDFPRGQNKYPEARWVGRGVNLGWLDLSPAETREFVTEEKGKRELSRPLVQKICAEALKDAARGQFNTQKDSYRSGGLAVSCVSKTDEKLIIELTGTVQISGGGIRYAPALYGVLEYDRTTKKFLRFDVLASGQRSGAGQFNARGGDSHAAPLGVAFELYQSN